MEGEKRYVVFWHKHQKPPEICEIEEVLEVRDLADKEDDVDEWVTFTRWVDDKELIQDGAPGYQILTEAEVDLVRKTWAFIDRTREEAKRLNREAKAEWQNLFGALASRRVEENE